MKRITFWILATISVVVLLFGYDGSLSGAPTTTAAPPAVVSGSGSGSTGSGTSGSTSGSTSGGSSDTSSTTKTGTRRTVTGAVAQTQWGPVQVALSVASHQITKVSVVQYPSGNPRDVEINDYALPILVRETTAQQSAEIDMVSGATVTSTGYLQSLQSALDQANL